MPADQGVGAAVIPGLGPVNAGHVGAAVGLLKGVVANASSQQPSADESNPAQIATKAQEDPARYGADLLLHGHNRKRYDELARGQRLPSQVWAQHESNGQLEGHLRTVHEQYGEQLQQLYRHRPMGERAILGLAAASGTSEDVARALDALRVQPGYPARVSFSRLVDGFSSPEIARIAAAFLPGNAGSESAIEVYRAVRDAREQTRRERRRLLFRRLCEQWAGEMPAIIPLFEGITRGFSPAQTEQLRLVLERRGNAEDVFEAIENDNMRRRLNAVEAAFRRWFSEWEASHDSCAQTPLQEPHFVLGSFERPRRPTITFRKVAVPKIAVAPAAVIQMDGPPDSERQIVLLRVLSYADARAERDADGEDGEAGEPDAIDDEAGALRPLCAPPPGTYAADGIPPWGYLTQGFGRRGEERLRRAWEGGRQLEAYREILARRGEETIAAREAEFLRCLEGLGCDWRGPCRIEREQLAALAPLGSGFTPEQWARLRAALTEGQLDPLEVWRALERENVTEAISVREPAFLRYVGAWGNTPRRNPVEWARTAPRLRRFLLDEEASGLLDEEDSDLDSLDPDEDRDVPPPEEQQGIASLFGATGGDRGPMGALGGDLRGFAEQALGALTGRPSLDRADADPTRALDEAAGLLDGADEPLDGGAEGVFSAVDKSVGALLGGAVAPLPPSPAVVAGRVGGFAEQASLDLQRVLALWGGPQSKLGEQTVRAFTGVGLTELAATPPNDLLRIVAGHRPSGSDPSGWWGELTAGQGLSERAEQELRKAIDTDGPRGTARSIATYVRLLQDATDAQKVLRDAIFTKTHEAAQGVAGPTFDPTRLPGGDPFVLLSEHTSDWARVAETMKSGNGVLEVFRQIEDARQERLLHTDAPAWMGRMLSALWEQRQKANWVPDTSGVDAEDAGAVDSMHSGHPGITPSGHLGSTTSDHLGNPMSGRPGSPISDHAPYTASGQAGRTAPVHPVYAQFDHPTSTLLNHPGSPPSAHQGNAPPAHPVYAPPGLPGNLPSGHQGNAPPVHPVYAPPGLPGNSPSGHQGNAPPAHQEYAPPTHHGVAPPGSPGNPPSGQQGYSPPAHQAYSPPAHQAYSPPAHQAYSPPAHQAYSPPVHHVYAPPALPVSPPQAHRPFSPPPLPATPPQAHASYSSPPYQGNWPPSHQGTWNNGQHSIWPPPLGNLPWDRPQGYTHGEPWNPRGTMVLPWDRPQACRPWGHQRTWESSRNYWRFQPGYQGEYAQSCPPHTSWGQHRTWGSARSYWYNCFGYTGSDDRGRNFWRFVPGRPHHHVAIGAAILGALLPFPFNLLLGHKHHREVLRREPFHGFWRRSPTECPYDPFRAIWQRASGIEGARQVVSELQRRFQPEPVREVVIREPPVREIVIREPPVREIVMRERPVREIVWCDPPVREPLPVLVREPVREIVVDVDVRPRPLYHLSFGRPMSEYELRRYLTVAPQLCAHPDGVLAEMAGLHGQARDVRGVDATTGEYLLLSGETLADIAHKLVGDRRRWRELEAANPLRAEGDPRLRIPPSWFGYVPYSIPIARVEELRDLRREGEEEEVVATDPVDAQEASDDAGYVLGRYASRGWRRRAFRPYASLPGVGSFAGPQASWGDYSRDRERDQDRDFFDADDASGAQAVSTPRRRYRVTHFDALGTLSPTYTRETAEQIVMQHKLFDGQRVLRPEWWAELRDVNPQKPLNPEGWWRDIREGESIWIPDFWPLAKPEPGPEATDAGGVWDSITQLNPFGAAFPTGNGAPSAPDASAFPPLVMPEMNIFGSAPHSGPQPTLTRQTYSVVRGDWPQKIAQKFGAHTRLHWLSEFQRANPHKPVNRTSGNWANLYAGEVINIPDAWSSGSTDTSGDGEAGQDTSWRSLAQIEAGSSYFLPLANYFRGTHDPEDSWARYVYSLAPYLHGIPPGNARATIEPAGAGFYQATPGASGPIGWRRATGNELRLFRKGIIRQIQGRGITFWVDPVYGVEPVPPTNDSTEPSAPPDLDTTVSTTSFANSADVLRGNMGPRQSLTNQTYTAVRGDWPLKIAQRFGAQGRVHWLQELHRANPHKLSNRTDGNWSALSVNEVVNIPDTWVSTDAGEEDDSDAGALRQNLTQRTYAVVAGDGMQRIAQKLGAASMGNWFGELRDANPHKKMAVNGKGKQLAWESLYPGEIINIPDAWPDTPQLRPAPGGVPTQAPYPGLSQFPAFPGGAVPSPTAPPGTVPAAATVDPGTILRVQAILIAFRQFHPEAIVPKDFGTGAPFSTDATGVLSMRTQQAVASFQRWSNAMAGSRLRSDGVLDPDTIAALDSFSAQAIGGLAQRPPVVPIGGAGPGSGDGNPLGGILGAAAAGAGDIARRAAPPVTPSGGDAPDPFAGAFRAAGDFVRNLGHGAQPGGDQPSDPPGWRRSRGDFDPRSAPPTAPPVLHELPGALQQYGIPGVPGLPGGAPHAPLPRRPRVDAPYPPPPPLEPEAQYDAPPEALAIVAKKTPSDEGIVPLVLAGLGLVAGVFV